MTKLYFSILGLSLLAPICVNASQHSPSRFEVGATKVKPLSKDEQKKVAAKNIDAAHKNSTMNVDETNSAIWRATKEEGYSYDEGEWLSEGSYERQFNTAGYATYELYTDAEGDQQETTYTYDEYNYRTSAYCQTVTSKAKMPYTKGEYAYDPIVHDFCISKINYDWGSTGWVENYGNYTRTVTRNNDGGVTSMVVAIPYNGAYTDIERTDITYDATTGQANTFVFSRLGGTDSAGNPIWNKELDLFDIEWDRTDGQLLREWQSFLKGNNRLKKASVYYNGVFDGYQIVTYSDGKDDYVSDETDIAGNVYIRTKYTTLDNNGSFRIDITEYGRNGALVTSEYLTSTIASYNERGEILSVETFETVDGETSQLSGEKYTYKYDDATGIIIESLNEMYNPDLNAYEPLLKIIYSNPIDVTAGVDAIEVDNTNAPIEYYNLQGIKVNSENISNGLYIKRQGATTSKILIK